VNESLNIEIVFNPTAAVISPAEVALLESILPDLIHAMMREEKLNDDD
jgi:hypothetical protein